MGQGVMAGTELAATPLVAVIAVVSPDLRGPLAAKGLKGGWASRALRQRFESSLMRMSARHSCSLRYDEVHHACQRPRWRSCPGHSEGEFDQHLCRRHRHYPNPRRQEKIGWEVGAADPRLPAGPEALLNSPRQNSA